MTITYGVRPYDGEIEKAYARFFPEDRDEKDVARLRWRFSEGPHGPGFFAVAQDNGLIAGMIGLVATRLRVGDQTVKAFQAIDTVVDPNYRGRGLFVGMGKAAQHATEVHGGEVLWGFPNANAAPGWFGRMEWTNFGTVPFMFRPLRTGYFLRKALPALGKIDLPLAGRDPPADPRIQKVERLSGAADTLSRRFMEQVGCAVDRGSDYLNWRLFDRPRSPYRIMASVAPDGNMHALTATCLLDKHDGRILYVMEAMAGREDQSMLTDLLRHEVARGAAQGADVALSWCPPGAPNREAYRKAGFLPLPDRLRPVAIHFGARPLLPSTPSQVSDGALWYLSYLDSDTV